jgi:hypothetical protein
MTEKTFFICVEKVSQLLTIINVNLNNNNVMWYNKIVSDDDNILCSEKYYVNENDMWEIAEECGIDIMGCFVCEFWSED